VADPRVDGTIRYGQDAERPGMLHGRILRSPYPHARVRAVRVLGELPAGALALLPPDVADTAPYGCIAPDSRVLAGERARFVGDPVAAVAAPDPRTAAAALAALEADYEPLPAAPDLDGALAAGAPLLHDVAGLAASTGAWAGLRPLPGTNVSHRFRLVHGRGEAGFDEAEVVVEGRWSCAGAAHAPLEPHAALAEWRDGRLTVWTGTQTPFNVRRELAGVFGLPDEAVRVVAPPMGGSFGAKTFTRIEAIAAALARKAGRPVRLVLPRDEVFVTLVRHPARFRVRIGARRDGTFVARRVWAEWDTGAYADTGPNVAAKGAWAAVGPYRVAHCEIDSDCVYTNAPPAGAFRGYAATQAAWAGEQCVDLLAEELGRDPLELRLQNVLRDGDRFATGEVLHDFHVAECLERVAGRIGWSRGRRGKGLCALMKGMQTPSRSEARIALRDGRLTVESATADVGQGRPQVLVRMAADALGCGEDVIAVADVDTDASPFDTRTTSSRSTHMMQGALRRAADDLRRLIADELEANPVDLRFVDGGVEVAGSPHTRRALAELGELVGAGEWTVDGGLDPDTGQGIASAHWHQGAAAAEVAVDEETGRVEITGLEVAVYAGRVVDPAGAELQADGSIVMGVGSALLEQTAYADGQPLAVTFSDYQVPAFRDVPRFGRELLERAGADVHGLGETALPLVPAAVGNALRSLRLPQERMPVGPEDVLAAVDRRGAA
jgi:CO/xanthine dehydrogenase Mo-binding subunit